MLIALITYASGDAKKQKNKWNRSPLTLFCAVYYVLTMSLFFFFRIWNWLVEPVPKALNRVVQ